MGWEGRRENSKGCQQRVTLTVVYTALNLHFWYIPYEYGRITKVALVLMGIYGLSLLNNFQNVLLNISLKLLLLVLYPILLILSQFPEKSEIKTLKMWIGIGVHKT